MSETTRLTYIACGKAKREIDGHPHHAENQFRAAELYTSHYFRLKREFAERMSVAWRILSAKHGAINPWHRLKPYDLRLTKSGFEGDDEPPFESVDGWAQSVVETIERDLDRHENSDDRPTVDEVAILAGRTYVNPLREAVVDVADWHDAEVWFPFDNTTGIGDQMTWLTQHTDPSRPVGPRYAAVFDDEVDEGGASA